MEEYLPVTFDDLYRAYLDCIKRKKNKFDAKKFEQYTFYNLKILLDEINERRYRLKQAKCFIVNDPTIREVFCCSFRDRVVHHFVYYELNPIIEKMLIFDAASCRKGKGTDFAVKRVQRFLRTASKNYTDTAYYLKFDLSGFFMNIDRQRMLELVLDVIHNRYEGRYKGVLDYLVKIIILTDITKGAKRVSPIEKWEKLPARKSLYGNPNGLPIGNLCSQIFANLYLNELDHIIKGRERFYSRYVDDAIIINSDRQYLINTLDVIREYLGSIGLSLNMKKTKDEKHIIIKERLLSVETRSLSMFRCICLIAFAVSIMMSAVNFFTGEFILMVYTFTFGILCGMNIIFSRKEGRWESISKVMFEIELCFLCLYFVVSGNPDGFSAIWLLLVPGCSFLLFEKENASILSIVMFFMLVFFFYTPAGRMSLTYSYSETFMLRFPLLYLAFTAVSMFLSYSIDIYQKKLQEVQERLEGEVKARSCELVAKEMELEQLKTEAMISQIQPHFMYNTISAIAAIPGNSEKTVEALIDFGKYLRVNLDTFSDGSIIPIDTEIDHVRRYVNLERLRFEDRIEVRIEMLDHDFSVPPLCVQMLVENAIKHGLLPQRKKGTVTVLTERIDSEHVITVKDDGVGFRKDKLGTDPGAHIGLVNVEERIRKTSRGRLEIESKKGRGTEVRIFIPEWKENYEDNST